jgi:hypothetical protein
MVQNVTKSRRSEITQTPCWACEQIDIFAGARHGTVVTDRRPFVKKKQTDAQ